MLVVALGLGGLVARTVQLQQQRDEQIARTQTIFDMVSRFDSPGTRHAWLTEAPGATPVAAVMVSGPTRQIVTVGLPANSAATDTYVLWGMGAGPPQAVGTFDVGSVESGPHDIGSGPGASYAGYAISIEPGRTAPASPSKVVASGQVEI
ncbi:anti-sigma factor domain-containing protein [Pseudonocardia benzenivorans]